MDHPLKLQDIKGLLQQAENSFRHEECGTCECYLGFLTQLEIDADPQGQVYLKDHILAQGQIHSCLGCDPCPPGILYEGYLRNRQVLRLKRND